MRPTLSLSLAALFLSLTAACSVPLRSEVLHRDLPGLTPAAEQLAAPVTNTVDHEIASRAAGEFLAWLEKRYGRPKYRELLYAIQSGSLADALYRVYGQSFYQISSDMLYHLDQDSGRDPMAWIDLGPIRVYYHPGGRAEQDLPHIRYLVQRYLDQIRKDVLLPQGRWQTIESNLSLIQENHIRLYLHDNASQSHIKSIAETKLGLFLHSTNGTIIPEYQVDMVFEYYGLLSSYTFVHEMSHALLALSRGILSPVTINYSLWQHDPRLAGLKDDAFFQALFRLPAFQQELRTTLQSNISPLIWAGRTDVWEEGMAEYLVGRYNLFQQAGLIPDVDRELAFYLSRGTALTPLDALITRGYRPSPLMSRSKIYQHYQLGHSFVRYLADTFGQDRLLDFYYHSCDTGDFEKYFGQSYSAVKRDWEMKVGIQKKKP